MGTTSKNTAKTATVMNLISRRPQPKTPAMGDVSDSDTIIREQIEYIDIDRIDDDPRNFYELSGLDELAANIEMLGLQQPIRVRPGEEPGRYIIVSGHRRRAAVRQLVMDGHGELRDIQCIVERNQESAALQELRLVYANSDTRKMTASDISKQAERVEALLYQLQEEGYEFPGRMRDHVAEACKVSKSKLARLKVIRENLAKPWRPAYEKGKLAEATAYALAQMPVERQQVIYDGLVKQGAMPGSAMEHMVRAYSDSLAQVETVECTTYGNGPCLNREAMREHVMGKSHWDYNHCCQCCDKCSELAKCKYACSMLADKVKQLKADAKAQREQEKQAKEDAEREDEELFQKIWKRFGEARAAAGKSVEEFFAATGLDLSEDDAEGYEEMERSAAEFDAYGDLPYGYCLELEDIRGLAGAADLFGVSLDYLLCRTDDPAGFAPQPEGQLVFNGWMPGGALPRVPCDVVADFRAGCGLFNRHACRFDGEQFCFMYTNKPIGMEPVRWMILPDVVSDSDTGEKSRPVSGAAGQD